MTLKLIPVESNGSKCNGKKQKYFNPGNKMRGKNEAGKFGSLKQICLQLVHFINRGSRFTYTQIDDLIVALQRTVLNLQKHKQEILKKRKKG